MVTDTRVDSGTFNQSRVIGEKDIKDVIYPCGFSDQLFKTKFRNNVQKLFGQGGVLGIGFN